MYLCSKIGQWSERKHFSTILIHFVVFFINVLYTTNKQTNIRPLLHFISIIIFFITAADHKLWPFHIFFASKWIPFIWILLLLYFLSSMHKCVPSPVMDWGFASHFVHVCVCVCVSFCSCHFHVHRCVSVIISIRQQPHKFRYYQFNLVFVIINCSLFSLTKAPIVAGYSVILGNILNAMKNSNETTIFHLFQRSKKYCHNTHWIVKPKHYVTYLTFELECNSICTMVCNRNNEHFHFMWIKMQFNF